MDLKILVTCLASFSSPASPRSSMFPLPVLVRSPRFPLPTSFHIQNIVIPVNSNGYEMGRHICHIRNVIFSFASFRDVKFDGQSISTSSTSHMEACLRITICHGKGSFELSDYSGNDFYLELPSRLQPHSSRFPSPASHLS